MAKRFSKICFLILNIAFLIQFESAHAFWGKYAALSLLTFEAEVEVTHDFRKLKEFVKAAEERGELNAGLAKVREWLNQPQKRETATERSQANKFRELALEYVDMQVQFLMGTLQSQSYIYNLKGFAGTVGPDYKVEFLAIGPGRKKSYTRLKYRFIGEAVFDKGFFKTVDSALGRPVPLDKDKTIIDADGNTVVVDRRIKLPLAPELIYGIAQKLSQIDLAKKQEFKDTAAGQDNRLFKNCEGELCENIEVNHCTDPHYYTEDDFWYFWDPDRIGDVDRLNAFIEDFSEAQSQTYVDGAYTDKDFSEYMESYAGNPLALDCPLAGNNKEIIKVKAELSDMSLPNLSLAPEMAIKKRCKYNQTNNTYDSSDCNGYKDRDNHKSSPQYDDLYRDGKLDIRIYIGYITDDELTAEKAKNDPGKVAYNRIIRELTAKKGLKFKRLNKEIETFNDSGFSLNTSGEHTHTGKSAFNELTTLRKTVQISAGTQLGMSGKDLEVTVQVVLANTAIDSKDPTFQLMYLDGARNGEIIYYDGHSGLGANLDIDLIEENLQDIFINSKTNNIETEYSKFAFQPKHQQIFFLNGCSTFSYFVNPYINAKAEARGNGTTGEDIKKVIAMIPLDRSFESSNMLTSYIGENKKSTEYVDIVTSGLPTMAASSSSNAIAFIRPFVEGKALTYQTMIDRLEKSIQDDEGTFLFSVSGDGKNTFVSRRNRLAKNRRQRIQKLKAEVEW